MSKRERILELEAERTNLVTQVQEWERRCAKEENLLRAARETIRLLEENQASSICADRSHKDRTASTITKGIAIRGTDELSTAMLNALSADLQNAHKTIAQLRQEKQAIEARIDRALVLSIDESVCQALRGA